MDPTLVRLLWLLMSFGLPPAGILGYIAAWIIVPMEPVRIYTTAAPASGNTV
jgi:phage shock protein PspC (stress-responsive transcriptional regulator)